jgi:hypothetical protein
MSGNAECCAFCGKIRSEYFYISAGPVSAALCSWYCIAAHALAAAKEQHDRSEEAAKETQQCPHCGEAF